MRHAGFLSRLSDATGDFVDDDVVVRGVAAHRQPRQMNGIVFPGFREGSCRGGNFESAGNTDDGNIFFVVRRSAEAIERANQ